MIQANVRGWKRLALGLMLVPGLGGVSADVLAASEMLVDQEMAAGDKPESAHRLMVMAREAFNKQDYAKAKELAEKAKTLPPNYQMGDDMPTDLLAEIAKKAPNAGVAAKPAPAAKKVTDPKLLVKQGRDALAAGKLEQAQDAAREADAIRPASNWGVFEDTPAALLRDVGKAKAKRDQMEAAKLMSEAKVLLEKKNLPAPDRLANLEKAQSLCMQADKLHGAYGMWDFGEKPAKVIATIESEKSKLKGAGVVATKPAATPTTTAAKTEVKASATVAAKPTSPYAAAGAGNPAPVTDPARTEAEARMKRSREYLADGKLVEARMECAAASASKVNWKADEENPAKAMQAIQVAAQVRIRTLCGDADACLLVKTPEACAKADACLTEAGDLAMLFALDSAAVMEKKAMVAKATAATVAAAPTLVAVDAKAPPVTEETKPAPAVEIVAKAEPASPLLAKARLELKKGELETARKMTIEVLSGPGSDKVEAESLLRTIEAEELAQRKLVAVRTFEGGITAFNNRDYSKAASMFKQVDASQLDRTKQGQLSELMVSAQAKAPYATTTTALKPVEKKTEVVQTSGTDAPKPAEPKESLLQQQQALQAVQFDKFRSESIKVESEATNRFGKGETDAAMKDLSDYIGRVKQSTLTPDQQKILIKPIEVRMQRLELVKHNTDVETGQAKKSQEFQGERMQAALKEQYKREEVAKLMKQFHTLVDSGKTKEADALAMKMNDLDPNDPAIIAAKKIAQIMHRQKELDKDNAQKEGYFYETMRDAETTGPVVTTRNPLSDLQSEDISKLRNRQRSDGSLRTLRPVSLMEKEIEKKLNNPINLQFKETPLDQVMDTFRTYSGVNITIDDRALATENLNAKHPVTENLTNISMRSALNIILKKAKMTYKIEDDVLKITSERHANNHFSQRAFPVSDLVVRIANAPPMNSLQDALKRNERLSQPYLQGLSGGGQSPTLPANGLNSGTPVSGGTMTQMPAGKLVNKQDPSWHVSNTGETAERELIALITRTIKPETWEEAAGQGRIEFHAPTMALVINQTPDIIEEVANLLKSLRRLQDREVSIEVKMIALSESFFERMGVDFSLNLDTKSTVPIINTGNNVIDTQNANAVARNRVIGLQAPGVPSNNLDIPIKPTSFPFAIPPFGGFQNNFANGGLALGVAFLNDIQVSMFLEAAQGDRRMNVLQAPKLTMFNGQSATIQITDQQFFMTGISVVSANGQLVFVPNNSSFPLGTQITFQPTISGDGTFVRVNINLQMQNLNSTNVPLFPITTFITPVFEGGSQGQPIPFTQYVQQPSIQSLLIQTTVAVPDGGTALLGGIKTLSEGRNEYGPPVLSKIPYINRLFRNSAYGKDTQSLLLMVTPRIIIQQEEMKKQTGYDPEDDTNPENQK